MRLFIAAILQLTSMGMRTIVMGIFLWLVLPNTAAFSQTVNRVFLDVDANTGTAILADKDSFILVGTTGRTTSVGNTNTIKVIKTNSSGDDLWVEIFGDIAGDNIGGGAQALIKLTNDTNYLLFGTEWPTGGIQNGMLYWFDTNGDTIRTKRISGGNTNRWLWQGIEENNGDLLGVGFTSSVGQDWQGWLVRTDSLGNVKWEKNYGGLDTEDLSVIVPAHNGGYLLSGITRSFGNGRDGYLVKVDTLGNLEWEKAYGTNWREGLFRVTPSADGNYYIWWVAEDDDMSNGTPTYEKRAYLGKIDFAGDTIWTKLIHQDYSDWVYMHQIKEVDEGRNLIVVGQKDDPSTGVSSGWVAKMDSSGNLIWERFYVNPNNSNFGGWLEDFQIADNGHIACVGSGNTPGTVFANQQDIWLLVVDSMGCLIPGCDTIVGLDDKTFTDINTTPTLYPNPATDQLHITLPDNTPTAQLELYSLLGAKLLTTKVHDKTPIDISQLPKGMYVYRLRVNGLYHTGKLIVE